MEVSYCTVWLMKHISIKYSTVSVKQKTTLNLLSYTKAKKPKPIKLGFKIKYQFSFSAQHQLTKLKGYVNEGNFLTLIQFTCINCCTGFPTVQLIVD